MPHAHYMYRQCEVLLGSGTASKDATYLETQWRNDHLPPLALCRRVTLKDDQVTTLHRL